MKPGDLRRWASMAEVESHAPVVHITAKEARALADLWDAALAFDTGPHKRLHLALTKLQTICTRENNAQYAGTKAQKIATAITDLIVKEYW